MEKNRFSTAVKTIKNHLLLFVSDTNLLPKHRKAEMAANLKRNWYFPISAIAFFLLYADLTVDYLIGLLMAFAASLWAASQVSSFSAVAKRNPLSLRFIAFFTSLGICWTGKVCFFAYWNVSAVVQELEKVIPVPVDTISRLGALSATVFVYICVLMLWSEMIRIFSENRTFFHVTVAEGVVYGVLIVMSLTLVVTSFAQSQAFYGTNYGFDVIYTSDSARVVQENAYLTLIHEENDLRQPLFAVFAAPFAGIPYLVSILFKLPFSVQAMLINIVQVIMLFAANFMLTKMMRLNPVKRICFMLVTSCTYTYMLFTLMMEQYIIAYFWLVFFLHLISEKQRPNRIALWGAGGTLLTSMILLTFMSEKNPIKNFKGWFADMVKYGMEFVAVMLAFCRFDVFFNLSKRATFLRGFVGHSVTMMDKIYQYTAFIRNCFFAPDAGINMNASGLISWQLNTVTGINYLGVVIILLVIVSAVLNRDKQSSRIAACWAVFSAAMLLGLGWGTAENGLILYALYFGWAFLVLLFQLVEKIQNKLNVEFLVPVCSIGCAAVLALVNIPAMMELIRFTITYFQA